MTINQYIPAKLIEEPTTEVVFVEREGKVIPERRPKGRILELVPDNDPLLKLVSEPFDFKNPPTDPVQLTFDLIETMKYYRGIGLSANQVGLPYRVFCMETFPVFVCFNPIIVDDSSEQVILEEGCLSYPNLFIRIKRARHIRARFTLPNGQKQTMKFADMTARVFQHEVDHLNGVIFYTRASLAERKRAFSQKKLMDRRMKQQ